MVYFNHLLMRGCRVVKQDAGAFNAFVTPNMRPLAELGIDTLQTRRKKMDLIQAWKIINHFDDMEQTNFFQRLHLDSIRQTRATSDELNLKLEKARTDQRKNFFTCRVVSHWNSLPEDVKNVPRISTFKAKLNQLYPV